MFLGTCLRRCCKQGTDYCQAIMFFASVGTRASSACARPLALQIVAGLPFLVNLRQNPHYTRALAKYVPTLMTSTSTIWSMRHNRQLIPAEHLVVMGLPIFVSAGAQYIGDDMPGIVSLLNRGKLSNGDILHAAGNGMVQIAVGTVLFFALGGFKLAVHQSESSSSLHSESDPEM